MLEIIGYFEQATIDLLGLTNVTAGTPIFLGDTNITHMKNRHPYEYDKYFDDIKEIIRNPDYVGMNPSDLSISFVKEYLIASEYVKVAVRVTSAGKYFARSLHSLSTYNAENYINNGTLKKVDKN